MKTRIVIFMVVLAVLISGGVLWFYEATSPVLPESTENEMFVIRPGEGVRTISNNLKDEGLIRDSLAFFLLVKQQRVEKNIQAGDFRLSKSMSAYEVLQELQHGTIDIWVTIPEGWRSEEIALQLAKDLEIPEQEFLSHAEEGYMFPDTYLFSKQASGSAIAAQMRSAFDEKVVQEHAGAIEASPFSLSEIVTLASLVERETRFEQERPIVASVLINRLDIGMKLDIDATVQYVLGYQPDEKRWWKEELTLDDLQVASPYNTYINPGLPAGPIANPGLSAIQAVLNPAETDYLYYLHDSDGRIHPAETFEEHQENIDTYL